MQDITYLVVPSASPQGPRFNTNAAEYELSLDVLRWDVDAIVAAATAKGSRGCAPWEASPEAVNAMVRALKSACADWPSTYMGGARRLLNDVTYQKKSHDWMVLCSNLGAR